MQLWKDLTNDWEDADGATFTGRARVKRSGFLDGKDQIRQFRVEFQPGARTNWHFHSGPQLLVVLSGTCLVQKWGEDLKQLSAGQTVVIEPGEKHWHGAGPDEPALHLALNVNSTTTWLEEVELSDPASHS